MESDPFDFTWSLTWPSSRHRISIRRSKPTTIELRRSRVSSSPCFVLEELRSRELILRHAPEAPAIVFDVGGAAGAHAFWLAERGYDVRLFNAVPRLVNVARRRNEHAERRLTSCRVADARALPEANESAAMVLLLGPLYHLVHARDRHAALTEAARVLRPGGVLIAAGISRLASALDGLARELLGDREFGRIVERDSRWTTSEPDGPARLLHDGVLPSAGRAAARSRDCRIRDRGTLWRRRAGLDSARSGQSNGMTLSGARSLCRLRARSRRNLPRSVVARTCTS